MRRRWRTPASWLLVLGGLVFAFGLFGAVFGWAVDGEVSDWGPLAIGGSMLVAGAVIHHKVWQREQREGVVAAEPAPRPPGGF